MDKVLALYIRVSTEEQAVEGNSLTEQQEQLVQFARQNGYSEYRIYSDDGFSAKSLERRPALSRLRKDVADGEIVGVITTRLDRLTRRVSDFALLIEEFNQSGIFYRSTKQNFEISTAMGKLIAQMLSVIAEFERELIAERVYENLQNMFKNGKLPVKPIYGYCLSNGKLVPHPEEAKWVRKAGELLLSGNGSRVVAKFLNDNGVRTKSGKLWSDATVRTLFQNDTLIGTLTWNQRKGNGKGRKFRDKTEWMVIPDDHEPILGKEEFEQINALISRRALLRPRARDGARLLSGIARCGFCSGQMHAGWQIYNTKDGRHRHKTYRCSTYVLHGTCVINRVDADELDDFVIKQLLGMVRGQIQVDSLPIIDFASTEAEVSECKRRIRQYDDRIQRLFDALGYGVIQPAEFSSQKERLIAERHDLNERLIQLEQTLAHEDPLSVEKRLAKRLERLEDNLEGDAVLQRAAVLELIQEVRVYRENWRTEPEVEIVYRL